MAICAPSRCARRVHGNGAMLRLAVAIAFSCSFVAVGCGGGVAKPALAPQPETAFAEVPYPPPPPRAEEVPDLPKKGAVWVDGQWMWKSKRWVWDAGGWVIPPPNGRFARWETHRQADGSLSYALGVWRDANGNALPYPEVPAPLRNEPRSNRAPTASCPPPDVSATAGDAVHSCPLRTERTKRSRATS
jgi:hypothetical protein